MVPFLCSSPARTHSGPLAVVGTGFAPVFATVLALTCWSGVAMAQSADGLPEKEISLVEQDVVSFVPMAVPSDLARAPLPVAFTPPNPAEAQEDVVIFAAPEATAIAAKPLVAGLPEPSIIVGLIEGVTPVSFDPEADVAASAEAEISYTNIEGRRKMQANDPVFYASLVKGGAFDPPEADLVVALQTELSQANCYTGRIDGSWGRGSRGAVGRFYGELSGVDAPTQAATLVLYRDIIQQVAPRCPDVQAPAPRTTRPARASSGSSRTRSTGTTSRPKPASKPAPAKKPKINAGGGGIGVFR